MTEDTPRELRSWRAEDALLLATSGASSLALVWLVWANLTTANGPVGFAVCWWVTFLAVYYAVVRRHDGPLGARDRVWTAVVYSGTGLLLLPLLTILGYVVYRGAPGLGAEFFTADLSTTGTLDTGGGAAAAIVGTLEQVGLAALFSVPLGLLTAIYLNEVRGKFRRPVRMFVDAMSGIPSIVAGLFVYAVWIVGFGYSFSGVAASFALAILMLPSITRTAEEVLRLVPDGLREGALALGGSQWRTVWSVVLPTAASGLVTAVVLGVARAVGETAPLIMTSFGSTAMNANPADGAQDSLPIFVYRLIANPFPAQQQRAWTAALVLVLVVLVLFTIARLLGGRAVRRTS